MKKILVLALSLILVLGCAVPALGSSSPDFIGEGEEDMAVYLYSMDTGKVIFEQNANLSLSPASLTKIMTCIMVLERYTLEEAESVVLTYPPYVQDYLYTFQVENGSISLAGLMSGEQVTLKDLLYGLMVCSGNETAMIIADHFGEGTGMERQESFAGMMNERAREIGVSEGTHFANPHGLPDPENRATAADLGLLTRHAMSLGEDFMELANTSGYVAGPTNKSERLEWASTNLMIKRESSYYTDYIAGVKTGTLPEAGRCLITTATRDGFTYLLVIMNAPYLDSEGEILPERHDYDITRALYEWVFSSYRVKILVDKSRIVYDIPLRLSSQQDFIQLVTNERITSLVDVEVDPATAVEMRFDIPEALDAPVEKGQHVGYADISLYGEYMGRVELVAFESVKASNLLVLWEKVKAVLSSFWFKFAVIFLVLITALYIFLMITRNRGRRRRSAYKPRRRL
jgi:D-alanyl-D-alanine carboxypeptidase (penicillin-binding protein 5/6)